MNRDLTRRNAPATSRRQLLHGGASLALWSLLPGAAVAGTRDPRLLVVILRGALDGLALAAPLGDPDYARLRRDQAIPREGANAGLLLDGFFTLNRAMPNLHALYQKREALIAHAVATPYRARSHFDGQDVLESGLPGVGRVRDGWLNRALLTLPATGAAEPQKGLAVAAVVPLVMRGDAPVLSWSPKVYGMPLAQSTAARLMDLYGQRDPALAAALAEGLEIERVSAPRPAAMTPPVAPPAGTTTTMTAPAMPTMAVPPAGPVRAFVETAETAAKFLSSPGGPRVGALSYDGWDTHANEGAVTGQLANRLAWLDAGLQAFATAMGSAWKETVVAVITEFGRTAAVNGTAGTDHGTATVALLLGGAVNGGRVLADWPGLSPNALFEGRDLAPTIDLRALLKGVLKDHLGLTDKSLADTVFPDSGLIRPTPDLLV
jgi:uncharacterized protein (DUF1501 family)